MSSILSKRWSLQQPNPTNSTLMKERWSLIQSGTDRKYIKIHNSIFMHITSCIGVNFSKHEFKVPPQPVPLPMEWSLHKEGACNNGPGVYYHCDKRIIVFIVCFGQCWPNMSKIEKQLVHHHNGQHQEFSTVFFQDSLGWLVFMIFGFFSSNRNADNRSWTMPR